jgi:UDP-N-acetylglucosamine--N-acetylmuramyl-(pentapeptide) pyrophosphoryl-undecaprenol N-acetylglucosamine transferase
MKIVFTGGGTGGHFYPLIAVAEALHKVANEKQLLDPQLFYIAPKPFDDAALFSNNITFIKSPAGKMRRYASIWNITGIFVTGWGTLWSLFTLYKIYPDVVFSKGGYASVPTVLAAHFLGIPIVIHESDAKPGRANLLAAKYAYRIAVAFESVVTFLPVKAQSKVAVTGIPIREELSIGSIEDSPQLIGLESNIPTVLIIGGSLGSQRINEMVMIALPDLISFANVIHQTGKDNFKQVESARSVILDKNPHATRYHALPYLSAEALRQAARSANIIVSRAGSTSITEISLWKKPAILIPIPEMISHDQRTNAYAYARTGAAVVLEEENMTPHVLVSEIRRITGDPLVAKSMGDMGSTFGNPNSARIIAEELIAIGLTHEKFPTETSQSVEVSKT